MSVTGSNVVSNAAGGGVRLYSNTLGTGGATFESISSTGGSYGIELESLSGSPFRVTGIEAAGSGGAIDGAAAAGVRASSVSAVELALIEISGGTGSGVIAEGTERLDLDRVRVTGAGDDPVDHGIMVTNLGSGSLWDGVELSGSAGDNVHLVASAVQGSQLTIRNSFLNLAESGEGLEASAATGATLRLDLENTQLNGNFLAGLAGRSTGNSTLDLVTLAGTTINGNRGPEGVRLSTGTGGRVRAALLSSSVMDNAGSGVGIMQGSDSPVELTVVDATIARAVAGTSTRGIWMQPAISRSDVIAEIGGATSITNFDFPLLLTADAVGFDASLVDLTVTSTGSFVSDASDQDGEEPALWLEADGGTAVICADLSNVTLDGRGTFADAQFENRSPPGTTFQIAGWDGISVLTTLAGRNVTLLNGLITELAPYLGVTSCRRPFPLVN